ncbi:unnamed protein product [Brassica oleracea var. botrytis]|uniref:Uncharacterized protein n=2 Tax=Brassica TaxID=3705 RepID=A0A8X7UJE6_BRACI|nr:hypothetical protein Bca52824_053190 [Brassica carinata]
MAESSISSVRQSSPVEEEENHRANNKKRERGANGSPRSVSPARSAESGSASSPRQRWRRVHTTRRLSPSREGTSAVLNFPELATYLPRPASSSPRDVQAAASVAAAMDFSDQTTIIPEPHSSPSSSFSTSTSLSPSSEEAASSTAEELSEIVELPSLETSYDEPWSEYVYVDSAYPPSSPWYFNNCYSFYYHSDENGTLMSEPFESSNFGPLFSFNLILLFNFCNFSPVSRMFISLLVSQQSLNILH